MDPTKLAYVHEAMRYLVQGGESFVLPEKAYKNPGWISSHDAKPLRILAEFLEPEQRFRLCGVNRTILFFGSARARSPEDHAAAVARATAAVAEAGEGDARKHQGALERLARTQWMCDVYGRVEELARRLSEWSMRRVGRDGSLPFIVSTGGGPGLMEAANKGAASVPGAVTAGIAISLPFEAGLNKYVTPELAFQHHYFFSRKHNLVYPARALVATPGGFGTADELFEVLTLIQSGKVEHPDTLPVVLFGAAYWRDVINWERFLEYGVISQSDLDRLYFTDSVQDAFDYVTGKLVAWEAAASAQAALAADVAKTAAVSAAAAAHAAALKAAAEAHTNAGMRSLVVPKREGAPELLPPIKPPAADAVDEVTRPLVPSPGV